jgi:hypothetical protein
MLIVNFNCDIKELYQMMDVFMPRIGKISPGGESTGTAATEQSLDAPFELKSRKKPSSSQSSKVFQERVVPGGPPESDGDYRFQGSQIFLAKQEGIIHKIYSRVTSFFSQEESIPQDRRYAPGAINREAQKIMDRINAPRRSANHPDIESLIDKTAVGVMEILGPERITDRAPIDQTVRYVFEERAIWRQSSEKLKFFFGKESVVIHYNPDSDRVTLEISGYWIDFDTLIPIHKTEFMWGIPSFEREIDKILDFIAEHKDRQGLGYIHASSSSLKKDIEFLGEGRVVVFLNKKEDRVRFDGSARIDRVAISLRQEKFEGVYASSFSKGKRIMYIDPEVANELAGEKWVIASRWKGYENNYGDKKYYTLYSWAKQEDLRITLTKGIISGGREFLSQSEIDSIASQLSNIVKTLRKKGVVHCNLTPENIILERKQDGKIQVKVRGFESAILLKKKEQAIPYIENVKYVSPELARAYLLTDEKERNSAIKSALEHQDEWAAGVVLAELCGVNLPWVDMSDHQSLIMIGRMKNPFFQEPLNKHSIQHLAWRALRPQIEQRIPIYKKPKERIS